MGSIFFKEGYTQTDVELTDIGKIAFIVILVTIIGLYKYQAAYFMNIDGKTATKGIFIKDTYDLSNYAKIGTGTKLICGDTIIYTRSAIHQTIEVCK